MKYPKAYYQIEKIKQFWIKSKVENKDLIIEEFNQALLEIKNQYDHEATLLEAWELAKSNEA